MADMAKPMANPNMPRNSRNFVFQSVDRDEAEQEKAKPPVSWS